MSEDSELVFEGSMLCVRENGKEHSLDLSSLTADDEGYVFRAEETYDPPTVPLDENGQGSPYAQFGYAAQMAIMD